MLNKQFSEAETRKETSFLCLTSIHLCCHFTLHQQGAIEANLLKVPTHCYLVCISELPWSKLDPFQIEVEEEDSFRSQHVPATNEHLLCGIRVELAQSSTPKKLKIIMGMSGLQNKLL